MKGCMGACASEKRGSGGKEGTDAIKKKSKKKAKKSSKKK